jgi:SNF2 family DNA or RNA helicase
MATFRHKTKPYKHQARAFKQYRNRSAFGYLWDVDTGKTWITINELAYHFHHSNITLGVVIAPKGMYHQWLDEWKIHCPTAVVNQVLTHQWVPTSTKKNLTSRRQFDQHIGPKLLVMNAEALSTKKGVDYITNVLKGRTSYMALDESSMFRNPKAKRTKAIVKMGQMAKYKRILTGTPASNSPLNLWSQFRFLDDEIFQSNYFVFRRQFAVLKQQHGRGGHIFDMVVGYRNLDLLEKIITPHCDQQDRELCHDMPPKNYRSITVDLNPEQVKAYRQMVDSFLVDTVDGMAVATMALTQEAKLRQISCGFVYLDTEENVWGESHTAYLIPGTNNRLVALMDLLSMIKGKVIIWADFRQTIGDITKAIVKEYGEESLVVYGTGDRKEKQRLFNESPQCRFFLCNPATGKYGLNLKPALNMVFYTNGYDLEQRIQCEGRMRERKKVLTVWDIVATNTIEEKIRTALINKNKMSKQVMGRTFVEWLTELGE